MFSIFQCCQTFLGTITGRISTSTVLKALQWNIIMDKKHLYPDGRELIKQRLNRKSYACFLSTYVPVKQFIRRRRWVQGQQWCQIIND